MKVKDYKGYEIHVNENGLFEVRKITTISFNNQPASAYRTEINNKKTMKETQDWVDRQEKAQDKRLKVLIIDEGEVKEGEITSIMDSLYYARVSFSTTNRQIAFYDIYHNTPENLAKLKESIELAKQANELSERSHKIRRSATTVKAKEVLGE